MTRSSEGHCGAASRRHAEEVGHGSRALGSARAHGWLSESPDSQAASPCGSPGGADAVSAWGALGCVCVCVARWVAPEVSGTDLA